MNKKGGLGRGFEALLPTNFDTAILENDTEKLHKLALSKIHANPNQPRRTFDEAALQGLAASIKRHGLLQPIVVTPSHEIIAGERRFRAAKLAGLDSVPVLIRTVEEQEKLELALIENVQRVQLAPLEQAASIEYLHQQFNLGYDAIAERLGKANSTVTNLVRLLQLPTVATEALKAKKITEGHARAILALREYPEAQADLLQQIIKQGWSVRQAERYATGVKAGHAEKPAASARVATTTPATEALGGRLKTAVAIRRTAKGGRLEITFKNDEDLERLLGQL